MKRSTPFNLYLAILIWSILIFFMNFKVIVCQELLGNAELRIFISNTGDLNYPRLFFQKQNTIWNRSATADSIVPITKYSRYIWYINKYLSRDSVEYNFIGTANNPTPLDTIAYSKYKFCLQDSNLDDQTYITVDSFIINYVDSMYIMSSDPLYYHEVDISIKYAYGDTNKFYYWPQLNPYSGDWLRVKDSFPDFSWGIWESNRNRLSSYQYPRTKSFVPEKPINFNVSVSSGSPYLRWSSNNEPFAMQYKIYRKLNNKYGTYINIADVTDTSYTDTEIGCAGYGSWTAYYYIIAKNYSQNSIRISASTDTLDIHYDCLSKPDFDYNTQRCFSLEQNHPNPFNPSTLINFSIRDKMQVKLIVYDILGKEIRILVNEIKEPGNYSVFWNGNNKHNKPVGSGVYIYRLTVGNKSESQKMILIH